MIKGSWGPLECRILNQTKKAAKSSLFSAKNLRFCCRQGPKVRNHNKSKKKLKNVELKLRQLLGF